jgi:sugar (pentulose or hexulose) kinase
MKQARAFAVDLGASGGKCFAGVFEKTGFELHEVHRFAHEGVTFFGPDRKGAVTERTYWDDTLLYANILRGLQEYRRTFGSKLDSIGIDTWGADGQFMGPDGDMLGKVYTYRDHRLDAMMEKVKARISPEKVYAITGIHFQPFNVSNQLYWFMENRRDLLRPGSYYLPVPSIFYHYLGGCRQVDSTWASVTQLMDAAGCCWSPVMLSKLRIPAAVMPPIVKPGAIIGRLYPQIAALTGVDRAQLVAVGSHDTASAYAAAPVENPDTALIISSGTWSLVGKLVPEPITTPAAMAANVSNEGGIGNVRLLKNCMGTWLVQELRRIWALEDGKEIPWDEIVRMAQKAPPFTAFVDPDDPIFYNPPNMQQALTWYCRQTEQKAPTDRGTLLRVVYESLALKYRMVGEQISDVSGKPNEVVHIVGGGSRNDLLNQFTADALDLPVVAGPEEATAVGNCMVQAMGLGLVRNMQHAQPYIRKAFKIREYRPQEAERWSPAFERFKLVVR